MFLLLIIFYTTDNMRHILHVFGVCLCISTLMLQDMCSMLSKYNEIDDCNLFLFTVPLCLLSLIVSVCMPVQVCLLSLINYLLFNLGKNSLLVLVVVTNCSQKFKK